MQMQNTKYQMENRERQKQMQMLSTRQSRSHSAPTDRGMNLAGAKRQPVGESESEFRFRKQK